MDGLILVLRVCPSSHLGALEARGNDFHVTQALFVLYMEYML